MVKYKFGYSLDDPMVRYLELPIEPEPKCLDLAWKRDYLEDEHEEEEEYYGD